LWWWIVYEHIYLPEGRTDRQTGRQTDKQTNKQNKQVRTQSYEIKEMTKKMNKILL